MFSIITIFVSVLVSIESADEIETISVTSQDSNDSDLQLDFGKLNYSSVFQSAANLFNILTTRFGITKSPTLSTTGDSANESKVVPQEQHDNDSTVHKIIKCFEHYANVYLKNSKDDNKRHAISLLLDEFHRQSSTMIAETNNNTDMEIYFDSLANQMKTQIIYDAILSKNTFVSLRFPEICTDRASVVNKSTNFIVIAMKSIFDVACIEQRFLSSDLDFCFNAYIKDLSIQTNLTRNAVKYIIDNSDHLPQCESEYIQRNIVPVFDHLEQIESDIAQDKLNLQQQIIAKQYVNLEYFLDDLEGKLKPLEEKWNASAAKEFNKLEKIMIDVVQPSLNICTDLESLLKQYTSTDDNAFWQYLRLKHAEIALKYNSEGKSFMQNLHTRFVSYQHKLTSADRYKQHYIKELNIYFDNALNLLEHFVNSFRFQLNSLMLFVWSIQYSSKTLSHRKFFLNKYKSICTGVWSTFNPSIRRLIRGTEGQVQTLFDHFGNIKNRTKNQVPLFYIPLTNPLVIFDLQKLKNVDTNDLSKRLTNYFKQQTQQIIDIITDNLTKFEKSIVAFHNRLLKESHKSAKLSPQNEDSNDISSISTVKSENDQPELRALTSNDDMELKQSKRSMKNCRFSFEHAESTILKSLIAEIDEKYKELIAPMETSITKITVSKILKIQMHFYGFVNEINDLCSCYIESAYLNVQPN